MADTKVWSNEELAKKGNYKHHPTDMMLRSLFSDNYFRTPSRSRQGTVLDIGTLFTNNLSPFSERGWNCYGTEVTVESVENAIGFAKNQNIDCQIKLGFNRELPFESNFFDVVLSIATLHYEENLNDIEDALEEISRVMKNNGVLLLQTVAPEHTLFKNSKKIKDLVYQVELSGDIRKGQRFVFFENLDPLLKIAKKIFSEVEVARCTENYPKYCVDLWLLKFVK